MAASDEARRLLAKAAEDEYVLDCLVGDASAPDSMVGFHAQQAAEKLLKAALFISGVTPLRTHNLAELVDLARAHGVELPEESEELRWLTPYAVLYRYDGEPGEAEDALARQEAREHIRLLRACVEQLLRTNEGREREAE